MRRSIDYACSLFLQQPARAANVKVVSILRILLLSGLATAAAYVLLSVLALIIWPPRKRNVSQRPKTKGGRIEMQGSEQRDDGQPGETELSATDLKKVQRKGKEGAGNPRKQQTETKKSK